MVNSVPQVVRGFDVVSGRPDLECLHTFEQFPVYMGCVDSPACQDLLFDMNCKISAGTGMIQIDPLPSESIVYQAGHGSGATGAAWAEHHAALADFIGKRKPESIFEIGGGHGVLSRCYFERDPSVEWTILEPNPISMPGGRVKIQKGFFTESTQIPESADVIVHSHLLEHLHAPADFFRKLGRLRKGVWTCFSVPALARQLEQCYTNVLNFEHTYYCTEPYIEWWLQGAGFELVEKNYFRGDHSIFYAARKAVPMESGLELPQGYETNRSLFLRYVEYHRSLVARLNGLVGQAESEVFLFGGHAFSQYLIAFGLDVTKIRCILDNDPAKHGRRLYGTNLFVTSPSILSGKRKPIVILRAGVFASEIKDSIWSRFAPDAVFLE